MAAQMRASQTNPPTEPVDPLFHTQSFVAASPLAHDDALFAAGAQVPGDRLLPEEFNVLRKLGVLKYPSEIAKAEDLAAEAAAREAALADANSEIEQLRAQIEALRNAPGAKRASSAGQ